MTNEIKKIVKQEVSIAEMDRDQLLDYLKNQLQEKQGLPCLKKTLRL